MAQHTAHHYPLFKLNLLLLAFVISLFPFWPRAALAQSPAQQILEAVNAVRVENGLAPLVENPLLSQAAQNHVNDMITNYVYGHYGSDGSTVKMRVARTGYSDSPWVSENWVSASNPNGAMRWWMNDYIHRVNILTAHWTEIGVGAGSRGSEMIFVTVFSAGGGAGSSGAVAAVPPQAPQAAPPPSVRIEQVAVPPEGLDYTIKPGDTLLSIGLRYGLPWERIAEANGLNEWSLLQIGQVLHIPGSGTPALPVPDVPTEEYIIQPNDTLFTIAARRGMFWQDVAAVNGFSEHTILQIGQVIKVPVVEEAVEEKAAAMTFIPGTPPHMVGPKQNTSDFANFTMLKFDPTRVASTGIGGPVSDGVGATSAVLAAYQVEAETGDALLYKAPVSATAQEPLQYEVQPGDTIISIAIKHNLEWGALLELNGLTESSVLQPGQMIQLR